MIIKKDFCLKFDGRPTSALPVSIGSHWPCKRITDPVHSKLTQRSMHIRTVCPLPFVTSPQAQPRKDCTNSHPQLRAVLRSFV